MFKLRSLFGLLPELVRTVLRPGTTIAYPFGELDLPDYFRGRVAVDPKLCRGCGLCIRDCPTQALELQRSEGGYMLLLHHDRCACCGQCELDCRSGAISLTPEFRSGAQARVDLSEVLVDKTKNAPPSPGGS